MPIAYEARVDRLYYLVDELFLCKKMPYVLL